MYAWWRVLIVTPGVFDSYVYFNWMGAAAQGLAYGDLFKWYALVIKGAWWVMSPEASLPEVWVLTRWLSLILLVVVGVWGFRRWSGIDRYTARILVCVYGGAIAFSIGIRPGAYSWYLPFGIFAFVAVACVYDALEERRYRSALVWSCLSVGIATLYPWYLMFVGIWLGSIWAAHGARASRRVFYAIAAIVPAITVMSSERLARWILAPAHASLLGIYERSGIVFSHVPFFANTIIAFGAWIILLAIFARLSWEIPTIQRRLVRDLWAWMALACLWFSTPFTGIHLYSDHLIGVTVILSWLSLATVLAASRELSKLPNSAEGSALFRGLLTAIAIGAWVFVIYIIQQPLRFSPTKFTSYVVHIIHWLALAVAASMVASRTWLRKPFSERVGLGVLAVFGLVIAYFGVWSMVVRDQNLVPGAIARLPIIAWIRKHVPPEEGLCSDPESASFYAAHTGLRIFPAEATLSYALTNEEVLHMLKTLGGAYSVSSSGNLPTYQFDTDHYRTVPCAAASKYSHNARWYGLFVRLGLTPKKANELIGCRQEVIDANWKRVSEAIDRHVLNEPAFRQLCPWVIIPDEQRAYWQLPKEYTEVRVGTVGIWSASFMTKK